MNYRQAAIQAQDISAFQIAAAYLRSALELLPQISEPADKENDFLERLGDCQRLTGNFEGALQRYQVALTSTPANDPLIRARILDKIVESQWPLSQLEAAIKNGRRALDELDPLLAVNAAQMWPVWLSVQLSLAWAYYWKLDLAGLSAVLAEIEPKLKQLGSTQQERRFRMFVALADFLRHRYCLDSRMVNELRKQLDHVQKSGDLYSVADAEFRLSFVLLWAGELMSAQEHFLHSLLLATDLEVDYLRV